MRGTKKWIRECVRENDTGRPFMTVDDIADRVPVSRQAVLNNVSDVVEEMDGYTIDRVGQAFVVYATTSDVAWTAHGKAGRIEPETFDTLHEAVLFVLRSRYIVGDHGVPWFECSDGRVVTVEDMTRGYG